MQMRAIGAGFERVPAFDLSLTADATQAVVDLAALKTPPGEYLIAFHGGAVAKHRHHPEAVAPAEAAKQKAMQEVAALEADPKKATDEATAIRLKKAQDKLAEATTRLRQATEAAQKRDIVDIVVSEPIAIRVNAAK